MQQIPFSLRTLAIGAGYTCLIIGFLLYIAFQARLLIEGPILTLTAEPETIQTKPFVTIEGEAENIVFISINGRAIMTTERGYFKEQILLQTGYTIISIGARDRYGRTTSIEREFVYMPQDTIIDNNQKNYGGQESSEKSSESDS